MSETGSSMEEDLRAVRIRHLGQCPREKGHENWFFPGAFVGMFSAIFVIGFINAATFVDREKEAILRGHATRDAITREFKWR